MTQQAIIDKTVNVIKHLPEDKAVEISDFAEFIMQRYEDNLLVKGFQKIASESESFTFLKDEENLYSISDLKEVYNEER